MTNWWKRQTTQSSVQDLPKLDFYTHSVGHVHTSYRLYICTYDVHTSHELCRGSRTSSLCTVCIDIYTHNLHTSHHPIFVHMMYIPPMSYAEAHGPSVEAYLLGHGPSVEAYLLGHIYMNINMNISI